MATIGLFYASYIGLWALILFHTLVLLDLVRRIAAGPVPDSGSTLIGKSNFLPTGAPAPVFEAPEVASGRIVSSEIWRGQSTILVFMAPGCPTCEETIPEVRNLHRQSTARVIVICRGAVSQCKQFVESNLSDIPVLLDETGTITKQFRVERTPTAVLMDEGALILRYGFPHSVARLGLIEWLGPQEEHAEEPEDSALAEVLNDKGGWR